MRVIQELSIGLSYKEVEEALVDLQNRCMEG